MPTRNAVAVMFCVFCVFVRHAMHRCRMSEGVRFIPVHPFSISRVSAVSLPPDLFMFTTSRSSSRSRTISAYVPYDYWHTTHTMPFFSTLLRFLSSPSSSALVVVLSTLRAFMVIFCTCICSPVIIVHQPCLPRPCRYPSVRCVVAP